MAKTALVAAFMLLAVTQLHTSLALRALSSKIDAIDRLMAKEYSAGQERTVAISGDAEAGAPDAPLVMVEFSDFSCPYCRSFANETWPSIQKEFVSTGRVRLVFKHLPLSNLHPGAPAVARAASCANDQGRFWPMHDVLFRDSPSTGGTDFSQFALAAGLDGRRYRDCMSHDAAVVEADVQEAQRLGISGTPTFLIGRPMTDGVRIVDQIKGAAGIDRFRSVLENALKVVGEIQR